MSIKCPLCGDVITNYNKLYISPFNKKKYKLYHCLNCDLEFWVPLKIFPDFYESEALDMYKSIHSGISLLAIHHRPFFKYFPFRQGRLLDIGCGNGVFLDKARDLGFEVYGIDLDKKSIKIAKDKFGLQNVYNLSLKEFVKFSHKHDLTFDIITFFEVLEHQDNPKAFLRDIKKILKFNGYIAGSVPNKDRLFADIEREINHIDYPPHHFLYFSKNSLRYLFEKEGFLETQFYPTKRSIVRLSAALEEMFSSKLNKNIRTQIKNFLLKEVAEDKEDSNSCLKKIVRPNRTEMFNAILFNMLNILRFLTFLPLTILIAPIYNLKGYQIYFQSRLKDK